jgi:hypothetical protein
LLELGDQQRWQPEIQMFALCALALAGAYRGGRLGECALALFRLYLTTVYLYSGLQKFNPSFAQGTGPWLVQPLLGWLRLDGFVAQHGLSLQLAVGMAAFESSLAVLLWLPPLRRLGVVLAMAMHASILLALGPLEYDWNAVIWPWNLFMLVAIPSLFWSERGWFVRPLLRAPVALALALVVLVYPLGHAAGIVDTYPAHNLYSGYAGASLTCLPPEEGSSVPAAWRQHLYEDSQALPGETWYCLDDFGWYYSVDHIPPYNAFRVQAAAAVALCDQARPQLAVLLEGDPPPLLQPNAHPPAHWARAYYGCDAIRRHARGYTLGGKPR